MLIVHELCLERHFQPVFQPLSFELKSGDLLVCTGPNGSGKTTLIRLLAGLLDPTTGTIERHAASLQYVGHDPAVKSELSVYENIAFYARLYGKTDAIESTIKTMGLAGCSEQVSRTLSAGQRKRTALARLMLSDAELWLIDEPYTNLDAAGVELTDHLIDKHLSSGGACVMATHGDHRPSPAKSNSAWKPGELILVPLEHAA